MSLKLIKQILIYIFIIFILVISNSIFFVVCEMDPMLEMINRVGNWTSAALWQTSKVFAVYALADVCYNIKYFGLNVAYSCFPVKWADKINGLLSFRKEGSIEEAIKHLEYKSLYRDTEKELEKYYIKYTKGEIKKETVYVEREHYIEVPMYIDKIIEKDKIVYKDRENLLSLKTEIKTLNKSIEDYNLLQTSINRGRELIQEEIDQLRRYNTKEFISEYNIEEKLLLRKVYLVKRMGSPNRVIYHTLVIPTRYEDDGFLAVEGPLIVLEYSHDNKILIPSYVFKQDFPMLEKVLSTIYAKNNENLGNFVPIDLNKPCLNISYQTIENKSSNLLWETKTTEYKMTNCHVSGIIGENLYTIKFIDFAINLLIEKNNINKLNIDSLIKKLSKNIDKKLKPNNVKTTSCQTSTLSEEEILMGRIKEYLEPMEKAAVDVATNTGAKKIIEKDITTNTDIITPLSIGSVGMIAGLTQLPLQEVLTYVLHLKDFSGLLHNPEVVLGIKSIYESLGQPVPELIEAAYNNCIIMEEEIRRNTTAAINNVGTEGAPVWKYILGGVCVLAIGYGVYWSVKNGMMDTTPTISSKEITQPLQKDLSKYLDLKK